MDNKMAVFNNREFGSIRVIEENGNYLFCGFDVAKALGYAKPRNAINTHCKGALKRGALTEGGCGGVHCGGEAVRPDRR